MLKKKVASNTQELNFPPFVDTYLLWDLKASHIANVVIVVEWVFPKQTHAFFYKTTIILPEPQFS